MTEKDLILNDDYVPDFEEISNYMDDPGRELWQDFNQYVMENYKTRPTIAYSSCSAKPGWNVKYKKSGKSLCTLYPEKVGFVALIVVKLALLPEIDSLDSVITDIAKAAKPFNGTKWLMIPVQNKKILEDVKELLFLKQSAK